MAGSSSRFFMRATRISSVTCCALFHLKEKTISSSKLNHWPITRQETPNWSFLLWLLAMAYLPFSRRKISCFFLYIQCIKGGKRLVQKKFSEKNHFLKGRYSLPTWFCAAGAECRWEFSPLCAGRRSPTPPRPLHSLERDRWRVHWAMHSSSPHCRRCCHRPPRHHRHCHWCQPLRWRCSKPQRCFPRPSRPPQRPATRWSAGWIVSRRNSAWKNGFKKRMHS